MIFAQYRDTVLEITELLQQHEPLVKVMSFIGQSSNGKSMKGFTQKEQLKVCCFCMSAHWPIVHFFYLYISLQQKSVDKLDLTVIKNADMLLKGGHVI